MKKIVNISLLLSVFSVLVYSCKESFLELPPLGAYDEASLANKKGINGMLINTYATLDGQEGTWYGGASNWVWGSVTGLDAYKGTEPSDQVDINPVMRFEVTSSNPIVLNKWNGTFDGIGQANQVLKILPKVTDMTDAEKLQIEAEAKFLRGHHHFEGVKMWKNIPYIDENVTDFKTQTNTANIWPQIEADFKFAYDNLLEVKENQGRANKWAAAAYLAKAYMFQNKFAEAKQLYDQIIANGKTAKGVKYGLTPNYHANFRVTSENNEETVFAIQGSYGDGATNNGNYDMTLAYPHGGGSKPGGCCGFFQPSQSFVNSFRTDATGLPFLDTYNATNVTSDEAFLSTDPFTPYAGDLDPRLDWSVGRRGIPYYDWGPHPGRDWIRQVAYGGPYSPKKNTYYAADIGATAGVVGWGWANNALNVTIMRYADVLLMAAEAEIEVGSLDKALEYINLVRTRAKNSPVKNGAADAANYNVGTYTTLGSKENARKIVRFERKLELGMEGHRFFDLVRWGIADTEINGLLAIEGVRRSGALGGASFKKGIHEYFPIPDFAISQSIVDGQPQLTQNPGY